LVIGEQKGDASAVKCNQKCTLECRTHLERFKSRKKKCMSSLKMETICLSETLGFIVASTFFGPALGRRAQHAEGRKEKGDNLVCLLPFYQSSGK
jgi:hypothetical protein